MENCKCFVCDVTRCAEERVQVALHVLFGNQPSWLEHHLSLTDFLLIFAILYSIPLRMSGGKRQWHQLLLLNLHSDSAKTESSNLSTLAFGLRNHCGGNYCRICSGTPNHHPFFPSHDNQQCKDTQVSPGEGRTAQVERHWFRWVQRSRDTCHTERLRGCGLNTERGFWCGRHKISPATSSTASCNAQKARD